jgi:hypothetical protein
MLLFTLLPEKFVVLWETNAVEDLNKRQQGAEEIGTG